MSESLTSPPIVSETPEPLEREPRVGIVELAESYGLAQTELELGLAKEQPSEWLQMGEEILEKNPKLEQYSGLFMAGVEHMLISRNRLDRKWQEFKDNTPEEPVSIEETVEIAGPVLSHKLFEDFTRLNYPGFIPNDPVRAEKGLFLWFFLSDRDADELGLSIAGTTKHAGAQWERVQRLTSEDWDSEEYTEETRNTPIVVIIAREGADSRILLHEGQHAKSKVISNAYLEEMYFEDRFEWGMEQALLEKVRANLINRSASVFEETFKEELEAYLTEFISYDYRLAQSGLLPLEGDDLLRLGDGLLKEFFESGGKYHTKIDRDKHRVIDLGQHNETVAAEAKEAVLALAGMRQLMIDRRQLAPYMADMVAIKMLRLFPLKSWPAVLRIAEAKSA